MIEFFSVITVLVILYFGLGLHGGEFGKQVNENMKDVGSVVLGWIVAICIITSVLFVLGGLFG